MQTPNPQDLLYRTLAIVAALAAGLLVFSHGATETNAAADRSTPEAGRPAVQPAEYFPAQFTIRPAADERDEPIPTF